MNPLIESSYPVIDAHCHPCPRPGPHGWADFRRSYSLTVPRPGQKPRASHGIMEEHMLLELARLFGCEPDPDTVMAERGRRLSDPAGYTRLLMQDAGIRGMVVDFGYPQPPLSPAYWREMTGVQVAEIFRIEPLIQKLLGECSDFASFRTGYLEGLAGALSRPDCAGLKSIIAYRTGLAVAICGEDDARRSFARRESGIPQELKLLRDWCLLQAMEMCRQYGKPMTIHTGAGDSEIKLDAARPELLYDVLTTDPYHEVPVVLVHAGYPWCRQAAFMVRVLANVYLDTSLVSPYAGAGVRAFLEEILHVAPPEKVMHGSDGFAVPEVAWLGAILTRRALAAFWSEMVDKGFVRTAFAQFALRSILADNARRVFPCLSHQVNSAAHSSPGKNGQ